MSTAFDATARDDLRRRLKQLTPSSERHWGAMPVQPMVRHLTAELEVLFGERPAPHVLGLLRLVHRLVRGMILGRNWPHPGVQKTSTKVVCDPTEWDADVARLDALLARVAEPAAACLVHPYLGRFSTEQWGVFLWRHADHHLRQFGV